MLAVHCWLLVAAVTQAEEPGLLIGPPPAVQRERLDELSDRLGRAERRAEQLQQRLDRVADRAGPPAATPARAVPTGAAVRYADRTDLALAKQQYLVSWNGTQTYMWGYQDGDRVNLLVPVQQLQPTPYPPTYLVPAPPVAPPVYYYRQPSRPPFFPPPPSLRR